MKRRRFDGKPETRSLDDLLAEASMDDVVQRLPGKGQPIDLGGYLHADAESRVANKLLADHHVIPKPLQDRREAEKLDQQADIDTSSAIQDLEARRQIVEDLQRKLSTSWPESVSASDVFPDQNPLPRWLQVAGSGTSRGDWGPLAAELAIASAVHNRRRLIARRKVEASLAKASEIARRLNTQVLLTRTLAPGVQMAPVRVQARLQHVDDNCPTVEAVPEDLEARLHRALRAAQPPWWKTLWRRPFQ